MLFRSLVLVPLDQPEQVLAEDLEDHADVRAVRALVSEVVEEGNDVGFARVGLRGREGRVRVVGGGCDGWGGGRDEPLEELDLVQGGFCVPWGGLDDLEGDMAVHSDGTRQVTARRVSDRNSVADTHFVSLASQTVEK